MIETQVKPCSGCGKVAGWWSAMSESSMVFFEANGDIKEERLFFRKRKHCAECDRDITDCVSKT